MSPSSSRHRPGGAAALQRRRSLHLRAVRRALRRARRGGGFAGRHTRTRADDRHRVRQLGARPRMVRLPRLHGAEAHPAALRPFPHLHRRGDRAGNGRDAAGAIAPAPAGFLSAFDRPMRHFGRYPVIPITLPRRDADRWKTQDAFFAWTGSPRPSRRESDNRRDRLRVRTNEERGLGATCVGDTSRANVPVLPGRRLLSHDRSVMGLRRDGHELPWRSPSGLGGNDPAAALGSGPRRRRS